MIATLQECAVYLAHRDAQSDCTRLSPCAGHLSKPLWLMQHLKTLHPEQIVLYIDNDLRSDNLPTKMESHKYPTLAV